MTGHTMPQTPRMRRWLIQLLVVVLITPMPRAIAAAEVPAGLAETINGITSQPRYRRSTWGFSVADLATGEVLYAQNADQMFVPGSIMKNYSSATVLEAYGPDYRFRTPVYRDGHVTNRGVLRGNLVLVAAGDFSFGLRERRNDTLAFNGTVNLNKICHFWIHYVEVRNIASPSNCVHFR